jgi:hypothetical protein
LVFAIKIIMMTLALYAHVVSEEPTIHIVKVNRLLILIGSKIFQIEAGDVMLFFVMRHGPRSRHEPRNRARVDVVAARDVAERFAPVAAAESPRSADAG